MARKEIKGPINDNTLNNTNHNFKELYDEFGNVVKTVSDKAFDKVVDSAKLNWKEPVSSQSNLPDDADEGDTRMTRDTGKVYRFDGSSWNEIQQIDAGPVNELDTRLTQQLADTVNRIEDVAINVSQFSTIQEAVDYADSKNVGIIFPNKAIILTDGFTIPDGFKIYGNHSTLVKTSKGTMIVGGEDCYIDNLEIDGNKDELGGSKGHNGITIGSGAILRNIRSNNNAGHGINILADNPDKDTHAYNIVCHNNGLSAMSGDGLYIYNSYNVYVDGVFAKGNSRTGVVVTTYDYDISSVNSDLSSNVNVSNVRVEGNAYNGVNFEGTSNGKVYRLDSAQGLVSSESKNCKFEYIKTTGFYADNHDNISIANIEVIPRDSETAVTNLFFVRGASPTIRDVVLRASPRTYSSTTFEVVDTEGIGCIDNVLIEKGARGLRVVGIGSLRNCQVLEYTSASFVNERSVGSASGVSLEADRVYRTHRRKPNTGHGIAVGHKIGDVTYNDLTEVFDVLGWVCIDEENQVWADIPISSS